MSRSWVRDPIAGAGAGITLPAMGNVKGQGKDALGRSDTPRRPPRPSQALGRTSRGPESSIRPGFTPQPARTRRRARAPSPKNATAATPLSVPYPYYTGTSSIWKQEKRKTQMAFIGYARVSAVDQDYDG